GVRCEAVIGSLREPSDFAGLPVVTDDGVRLEPPAWEKRLQAAQAGYLFIDELSTSRQQSRQQCSAWPSSGASATCFFSRLASVPSQTFVGQSLHLGSAHL